MISTSDQGHEALKTEQFLAGTPLAVPLFCKCYRGIGPQNAAMQYMDEANRDRESQRASWRETSGFLRIV
jgi:hypothetical protein